MIGCFTGLTIVGFLVLITAPGWLFMGYYWYKSTTINRQYAKAYEQQNAARDARRHIFQPTPFRSTSPDGRFTFKSLDLEPNSHKQRCWLIDEQSGKTIADYESSSYKTYTRWRDDSRFCAVCEKDSSGWHTVALSMSDDDRPAQTIDVSRQLNMLRPQPRESFKWDYGLVLLTGWGEEDGRLQVQWRGRAYALPKPGRRREEEFIAYDLRLDVQPHGAMAIVECKQVKGPPLEWPIE